MSAPPKRITSKHRPTHHNPEKEKLYYTRWESENTLINQRLTWLLISQGLLFAAYGTIGTKAIEACGDKAQLLYETIRVVRIAGIAFAILVLIGIAAAIRAQFILHRTRIPPISTIGVSTPTTILGWANCLLIPIVFLAAWIYLQNRTDLENVRTTDVDCKNSRECASSSTASETKPSTSYIDSPKKQGD